MSFEELMKEFAGHFERDDIRILAAVGLDGYPLPQMVQNNRFGDQRPKLPHLLAVNDSTGENYIGIIKTAQDDLESTSALTEYDLYLDLSHGDEKLRLCIYLPQERLQEFNSLITHYIHPDYWKHLVIMTHPAEDSRDKRDNS